MKNVFGLHDAMTSIGAGLIQQSMMVAFRSVELGLYCWVYNNWRIMDLPWDSLWTWMASFIAVDFAYYWFHRAGHEINVLWALHQTHHSSEYYNLTTALRQGMFQQYGSMFFYLPEALFIPPQVHLVHTALNLLYQFWIHTQAIGTLGPLEKILNTPAAHRVHHGRNRYCIDKNYAGVLIIWDRMFGTYQPELETEEIAYGLVNNVNSFDALHLQTFYLKYVLWTKPASMTGIWNKVKAIFNGPGWFPGTGRLGNLDDIPDIEYPVKPYNTQVSWISIYALIQGIFVVIGYQLVASRLKTFPWLTQIIFASVIILSVQVFGYLMEKKKYGPICEVARCLFLYIYCCPIIWATDTTAFSVAQLILMASTALWIPFIISSLVGTNEKNDFAKKLME